MPPRSNRLQLAKKRKSAEGSPGRLANVAVEPARDPRRSRRRDIGDKPATARSQERSVAPGEVGTDHLRGREDPPEDQGPELGVGHDQSGISPPEKTIERRAAEPKHTLGLLTRWAEGEQEFRNHRCRRRPFEIARNRKGAGHQIDVTEGGEFGARFLVQTNLDPRQDLGGAGERHLAAARAAQDPSLNPIAPGEHRKHQVTVAKGMMVQDQSVVVDDCHRHMISDARVMTLAEWVSYEF